MTPNQKIWPYAEAAAHLQEILQRAANGEPQMITDEQGRTFNLQVARDPEAVPFVSGMSIYENFPPDTELVTERITDTPRDIDL